RGQGDACEPGSPARRPGFVVPRSLVIVTTAVARLRPRRRPCRHGGGLWFPRAAPPPGLKRGGGSVFPGGPRPPRGPAPAARALRAGRVAARPDDTKPHGAHTRMNPRKYLG